MNKIHLINSNSNKNNILDFVSHSLNWYKFFPILFFFIFLFDFLRTDNTDNNGENYRMNRDGNYENRKILVWKYYKSCEIEIKITLLNHTPSFPLISLQSLKPFALGYSHKNSWNFWKGKKIEDVKIKFHVFIMWMIFK